MSMITSSTIPKSNLKKRHNANAYNRVREAVAARIVDLVHCDTSHNLSDMGTKPLGPQVFQRLVHRSVSEDKFPPCGKDEGELKQVDPKMSGKSSTGSATVGYLAIDHLINDRELTTAFGDATFRSYVVSSDMKESW